MNIYVLEASFHCNQFNRNMNKHIFYRTYKCFLIFLHIRQHENARNRRAQNHTYIEPLPRGVDLFDACF